MGTMFYNFKDQIVKSIETCAEYHYRRYFFQKVPSIVPSLLFLKSICAVIVGTLKVPSAHLWLKEKNNWPSSTSRLFGLNGYICVTVFPKIQKCFARSEIDAGFIPKQLCLLQCLVSFIRNTLYAYVRPIEVKKYTRWVCPAWLKISQ